MTARRPWRGIALLLVLLLGLGVLPFAGLVPDPLATDSGLVVTGIRARAPTHALISHQVYGYLPYWQLDGSTAKRLRYDLLTTIAMFGIGIDAPATLTDDTGLQGLRRAPTPSPSSMPRTSTASGSSRPSSCSTAAR